MHAPRPFEHCYQKENNCGFVVCILGPMFSGKTSVNFLIPNIRTELIRMHDRYRIAKKNCILVKYAGDTRYDSDLIVTHQRNTAQGATLKARSLRDVRAALFARDTQVIAIDEGQFFDDLSSTCEQLACEGKIVIVAALDGTFMRKVIFLFESATDDINGLNY
uniref:Thymidine kinase n=1 Tax=Heterorhabditis bacteriophora TaxID=37862 RepID=A0A1I7W7N8_HETBA